MRKLGGVGDSFVLAILALSAAGAIWRESLALRDSRSRKLTIDVVFEQYFVFCDFVGQAGIKITMRLYEKLGVGNIQMCLKESA